MRELRALTFLLLGLLTRHWAAAFLVLVGGALLLTNSLAPESGDAARRRDTNPPCEPWAECQAPEFACELYGGVATQHTNSVGWVRGTCANGYKFDARPPVGSCSPYSGTCRRGTQPCVEDKECQGIAHHLLDEDRCDITSYTGPIITEPEFCIVLAKACSGRGGYTAQFGTVEWGGWTYCREGHRLTVLPPEVAR